MDASHSLHHLQIEIFLQLYVIKVVLGHDCDCDSTTFWYLVKAPHLLNSVSSKCCLAFSGSLNDFLPTSKHV